MPKVRKESLIRTQVSHGPGCAEGKLKAGKAAASVLVSKIEPVVRVAPSSPWF